MEDKKFENIEKGYTNSKKQFQEKDIHLLSEKIAEEIKGHSELFKQIFEFLINVFKGRLRRDNKTPLAFHSIYLAKLLYLCNEKDIDTLLIASLHDVLEDTEVNEDDLIKEPFLENKKYLIDFLKILKEDKNLSREPDGRTLPPRYREHIKRIIGASKEVINVEIIDRFCDLMDLDYITSLPNEERELRLKGKLVKVRGFIENITRNRKDINQNCLKLFNYKLKKFEDFWNLNIKTEIIF